jgi:glycosyltransferase involved in cell wall biosynthesis
MRVLVSAYACQPGAGSEPGAGWEWARAAAVHHEVWLLTRRNLAEGIEQARRHEQSLRLHPVYVDLPAWVRRAKRGRFGIYWYYPLWQVAAFRTGRRLHREVGFEVVHHVTLAMDWMPAGVAFLRGVPLVWGPVGGATGVPLGLARWLGLRGCLGEFLREVMTRPLRLVFGRTIARRATLMLAQNHDVAAAFPGARRTVIEPHSAIHTNGRAAGPASGTGHGRARARRAVFVGRLVAWKGPRMAIAAIARPEASAWTLDLYGDGRQLALLRRFAERLGVADRVTFKGQRPRTEAMAALSSADALLFPSIHDQAPFAVAEALSLGCPVVCLDRGGPAVLVGEGEGVKVRSTGTVVEDLAAGLAGLGPRIRPVSRWSAERLPGQLAEWYREARRPARSSA